MARLHPASLLPIILVCGASFGARAGDSLSRASSRALTTLRTSIRRASSLHAGGLRTLAADLRAGRTGAQSAFTYHAAALTHLSDEVDRFADEAAAAFLADAAAAMSAGGDVALDGAVPGDGGSLDDFQESVRNEVARARSSAVGRVRTVQRAIVRAGGGATRAQTLLPPWTFDLPGVPTASGTVMPGGEETPRVRVITAARFTDGRLFFTAAGTAAPEFGGKFELWLRAPAIDTAGPRFEDGGVEVTDAGTWSVSTQLGNPFTGTVPLRGNRVVQFATDPVDMGLAGLQPTRFIAAGAFALP